MKSLDFLEKLEKDYHNNIIGLYYRTSISKEYRDKLYDKYNKDFEKIKQDLEVLEIIKNKKVDMTFLIVTIHSNLTIDEQINYYNIRQCNYCKLINEEFIKLKQWLEENENDN